eukprot:m.1588765 g.1588765  ORF g.1588765 m.1588765 type:complete len:284 (+) comp25331_c2_seq53:2325-3176(+)
MLEMLFKNFPRFTALRTALRDTFIHNLLLDPKWKLPFALAFLHEYPVKDALGTANMKMWEYSVQLFTVPSVATELISKHNALLILLKHVVSTLQGSDECADKVDCKKLQEICGKYPSQVHVMDVCEMIFVDIRYLLDNTEPNEQTCAAAAAAMPTLLKVLSLRSGMDPMKQEYLQHVGQESDDWKSAIGLSLYCDRMLGMFVKFLTSSRERLTEHVALTIATTLTLLNDRNHIRSQHNRKPLEKVGICRVLCPFRSMLGFECPCCQRTAAVPMAWYSNVCSTR